MNESRLIVEGCSCASFVRVIQAVEPHGCQVTINIKSNPAGSNPATTIMARVIAASRA